MQVAAEEGGGEFHEGVAQVYYEVVREGVDVEPFGRFVGGCGWGEDLQAAEAVGEEG